MLWQSQKNIRRKPSVTLCKEDVKPELALTELLYIAIKYKITFSRPKVPTWRWKWLCFTCFETKRDYLKRWNFKRLYKCSRVIFRSVHTQKSSLHPKMFQNHRSDDHFDQVEVKDTRLILKCVAQFCSFLDNTSVWFCDLIHTNMYVGIPAFCKPDSSDSDVLYELYSEYWFNFNMDVWHHILY